MMERDEKLIWEYLDGQLSSAQGKKVEKRLLADASFKKLYDKHAQLHSSLQHLELVAAPDHILSNVMVSIKQETIQVSKPATFGKVKLLAAAGLLLSLLLVIIGLSFTERGAEKSIFQNHLDGLMPALDYSEFFSGINLPNQSILFYGSAVAFLLIFYWAEELLSRLRYMKTK